MVSVAGGPQSILGETLTLHGLACGAAVLALLWQPCRCVPCVVMHLRVQCAAHQLCYWAVVVEKSGMVTQAFLGSCCCLLLLCFP